MLIIIFSMLSVTAYAVGVPEGLIESNDKNLRRLSAVGVQVYECRVGADGALSWAFKEPRAELFHDGQPFGQHYAGPTWEAADGSRIIGQVAATAPAPQATDIPWLRLTVIKRTGAGALAEVEAVQRVDTHGGEKVGSCTAAGTIAGEPYTADYILLGTTH
ncbi:DUF3455 domain-containing protein [Methylobacterium sp. 092160098-2]|uniref:DUF3455 domain-containing protein n=1 Tax=Methylobacterium sp. 092160098-2 TaxID=3025129 RepID=UPI002381B3F8|nr:DUF3455 domain-containing protein [Methylobacterium sp. 092160098-2]MDE4915200.1 DUF3455 domain-containing protein [Methylobacterium sp. 092160098-2]